MKSFPSAAVRLTSFDGGVSADTILMHPDRYGFFGPENKIAASIPRGAGLSYAAASFSASSVSVDQRAFDRLLAFDPENCRLEVEAGISLGQIERFLTPRGFFLPVQPGHPTITVGGCAASDVHGKNQFLDGTFSSQTASLVLFHPTHGTLQLSPSAGADLFELTCGGYGLTGHILSLKLKIKPIPSGFVRMTQAPIPVLEELPAILKASAARSDLLYTWHDFTRKGAAFGQGILNEGRFASPDECAQLPAAREPGSRSDLNSDTRGNWKLGFFNRCTTPLFNRLYGYSQSSGEQTRYLPLYDFLFPVHDKEAYFKLFGQRGFMEYQSLIPEPAFRSFCESLRRRLARFPVPITLASAKLFKCERKLLRFTGSGICLALNFPRTRAGILLAEYLDMLMLDLGGWPNLIKDSRLSRAVVEKCYPEYGLFRERLHAFDPARLFRSELSERLGL